MARTTVRRQLDRLARLDSGAHPIVTCYLKLEPRDRERGKYFIKLKNRVRAARARLASLELSREEITAAESDLERVLEALQDPIGLPPGQGVAVFASRGHRLFEVVPLPRVYRSRLVVDRSPLVRELVAIEDEVGRILTTVVDRGDATIFEVTAWDATVLETIRSTTGRTGRSRSRGGMATAGRDTARRGTGDAGYRNRIAQDRQRHFEIVAQRLFDLDRRNPAHGFVLAGSGTEPQAVEPFLHPYLVDRYIGHVTLNAKDKPASAVHEATLGIREAWERDSERDIVSELEEGLGNRWAVNGVKPTLRALSRGQVRSLLVNAEASMEGVRDAEGRLGLLKADLRGGGTVQPVHDVIDDAIEEALRQRVSVNVIHDASARTHVDGLAGMLRFR